MKRFFLKLISFVGILAVFIYSYLYLFAGTDPDNFYRRFTVGKQTSLILGSSRAAQGIEPSVINEKLNLNEPIYNYAFTVNRSVWGPPHLKAIKRKLKDYQGEKGLFIIECNPWSFFTNSENLGKFPEKNAAPNSIIFPNMEPNIEYFFGSYLDPNIRLMVNKLKGGKDAMYISSNGRLVLDYEFDSIKTYNRIKRKLIVYEKQKEEEVIDETRFEYLAETINFLSKRGEVYLVRLPNATQMVALEEKLIPDFDERMSKIENAKYINLKSLSDDYITIDGNHIHNQFISKYTNILTDSISNYHN